MSDVSSTDGMITKGKGGPSKLLAVLALFTSERPVWQPDEINAALGYTRATGYRYVKELVDAGLLQKLAAGRYGLGPRIIALDYQLRRSDPVLLAADPVMHALSASLGREIVLTVLFGNKQVIDTHRVHALEPASMPRSRGRLRPLFQSGAPKVLLSLLPRQQQMLIYRAHAQEIAERQMGQTWEAFRDTLGRIRRQGFYLSWGELEPDLGAAVVPVFNPDGENVAALSILDTAARISTLDASFAKAVLEEAAWKIRHRQSLQDLIT